MAVPTNTFLLPENPLKRDSTWENLATTVWFSVLTPSVKCNSSCLFYLYIKLTLEAGKWKENECHAGTYFFTKFFFTPDSDPNPTIESTWLAVLIEIWDEGVGYKQQFCRAARLGCGPLPFPGSVALTPGCAARAALPECSGLRNGLVKKAGWSTRKLKPMLNSVSCFQYL